MTVYNQKDNKDFRRGVTNKVSIIVRNIKGEVAYEYNIPQTTYRLESYPRQNEYTDDNIMKFSKFQDLLCLDDLIVDVIIQYQPEEVLIPKSPLEKNMFQLFNNEQYSDVTFKVEGDSYPEHKLVLSMNAPILANMCGEPNNGELDRVVEIKDTTSRVFNYILQFIYGGNTPKQDTMVKLGKEIIDACDKYDVVGLKIATESTLVWNCIVNFENVVDWIQYADAKNCPLLKEYALSYFVARYRDISKTASYKNMKQCPLLMEEVVMAMQPTDGAERFVSYKFMSVNRLRLELAKHGWDVDGSKEVLASRLEIEMNRLVQNFSQVYKD